MANGVIFDRMAPVVLAGAALAFWAAPATALDRVGAIEVAKREVGGKCTGEAACEFNAKVEEGKWHVRVDFPQGKARKAGFGGHTIFIINQSGRVVGRVEGKSK